MSLSILLVDDDPISAPALARFLMQEGHHLERVETGEAGLRLFRDRAPDLVLLDLELSDISGLEVLDRLRKLDESAAVIVTADHGSIEVAVAAMRLGALDFLTKPIDPQALRSRLRRPPFVPHPSSRQAASLAQDGGERLSIDTLGENPLKTAEIELIRQALARSGGRKNHAARLLGISRFALQRKLKKFADELAGSPGE